MKTDKGRAPVAGTSTTGAGSLGPGSVTLQLTVNGQRRTTVADSSRTLLQVLREQFGLTGNKQVCDRATCGACTVLRNGIRVYGCSVLAVDAQDDDIVTIEGLTPNGQLSPLQQAFADSDAMQCGYCTPGFIVSATAFLKEIQAPARDDVRRGLAGNFCRCGSYEGIEQAVLAAGSPVSKAARSLRRSRRPAAKKRRKKVA
jgi:aerobic-type carbon monoxide dehydrogenase small subunit (CoxS/CutS family)